MLAVYTSFTVLTSIQVFPFSILMDSSLRIRQLGQHVIKLFPSNTPIVGRALDEVFRLIRPDIHVEWNKVQTRQCCVLAEVDLTVVM